MKIYLARHSETDANTEGLIDPNAKLNELGIRQSEQLRDKLAQISLKLFFISELPRTRQTATIVNEKHHVPIVVNGRLNEIVTGFEGQPMTDWHRALADCTDPKNASFNGGESLAVMEARVGEAMQDIKDTGASPSFIVAHGYPIQFIYKIVTGCTYNEAANYDIPQGEYAEFSL